MALRVLISTGTLENRQVSARHAKFQSLWQSRLHQRGGLESPIQRLALPAKRKAVNHDDRTCLRARWVGGLGSGLKRLGQGAGGECVLHGPMVGQCAVLVAGLASRFKRVVTAGQFRPHQTGQYIARSGGCQARIAGAVDDRRTS